MKRILFAWEFGSNLGHLSRDLPLARQCLRAGHDVLWAVPDPRAAQQVLALEPFKIVQSPRLNPAGVSPRPPVNYADMLLTVGFHDDDSLIGSIRAWRSLMALFDADAIVFNHAPSALLAARTLAIPVLVTGTGFEVPPSDSPLPTFRPWERASRQKLEEIDSTLLAAINRALGAFHTAPVGRLRDIFCASSPDLTTFEELDPFGPRTDARYIGPVFSLPELAAAQWHTDDRDRVFAYLRPDLEGCEELLGALQASRAEVMCFVPGAPDHWRSKFDRIRFHDKPVAIEPLLATASLTITSGAGTIATSLLAGVPVMVVPHVVEQHLAGRRLSALGAGLCVTDRRTTPLFGAMLHQLLVQSAFKTRAAAFAGKYHDYSQARALGMQFDSLEALLAPQAPEVP